MLRDLADLVRNLLDGDTKRKPADPLRGALQDFGATPSTMETEIDLILNDAFNASGFSILILKTGNVWHVPAGKVGAIYRRYQKYAEIEGGSTMQDMVESLGCAVVVFDAKVMDVGVRVHMPRRSVRAVIDKLRDLQTRVRAANAAEVAANKNSLKSEHILSFRVTAYEGARVFRNAFLR